MVFAYAEQENWTTAMMQLNALPSQYSFNIYQQELYGEIQQVISIWNELFLAGNSIFELSETQKSTLLNLADNSNNVAGAYARSILIKTEGYEYTEPIILPEEGLKSGNIVFDIPNLESFTPDNVKIYPNPALDYIIVELNKANVTGAVITIIDKYGKQLRSINIPAMQQNYVVGLNNISSGIYVLNVNCNGEKIGSKKFTVLK